MDARKVISRLNSLQRDLGRLDCNFWGCNGHYRPTPVTGITCARCQARHSLEELIQDLIRDSNEDRESIS